MKSSLLVLTLSLSCVFGAFAQKKSAGSIRGSIADNTGNPVAYATLMLLDMDSALVKAGFSKEDGSFMFEYISAGKYQVKLRSIQYQPYVSHAFTLNDGQNLALEPITVAELVQQLEEIKVTAIKPLVEVHPDKTVFNVAASPNTAGTDALEMLKKAPGVVVDNNDNIMLQGKSGVKIYIDGKPTRLTGDNLANMLRSMQSDGVEAVDIITNPSAKYDAEGNAGIIDIKLKRDKNLGLKGTINAGYNIGRFKTWQSGTDFNYRDRKLNVFGNYNYRENKGYNAEKLVKTLKENVFKQESEGIWANDIHDYRIGADYSVGKKHLIGFVANGYMNGTNIDSKSSTPFGNVQSGTFQQQLDAVSERQMSYSNINSNLNYVYTGTKGAKLNVDADYGYFFKGGDMWQSNIYKNYENGNTIDERYAADRQSTRIGISALKSDYEKSLGQGKLLFGGKFSSVSTDNVLKYFNILGENKELDPNRSNNFVYDEEILAAYALYNGKINSKFTFNAGLRSELTTSNGFLKGEQNMNGERVKQSYADVFPSGGVAYQIDKKNKLAVNYSKRIDRPNYQHLNPFVFHLDELTSRKGNPFLRPQYTNSFKLTHSFNQKLNTQISYSKTNDYFAQLLDTVGERGVMISVQNMASSKNIGLNVNYSMDITKKWSFYTNGTFYKSYFKSEIPGKDINLDVTALNLYGKTNFLLPSDINLEISGWYNSPAIWGGTFKMQEQWALDMGIKKPFWDKRATVKVSVSDIFKTRGWRGVSEYGGLKVRVDGHNDSRVLRLGFTYNLGNQQVKGSRNRTTGLDEEKNRAGGNGQ